MLGELASVGVMLAKGFTALGIDVDHFAHQHSWRRDSGFVSLTSPSRSRLARGLYRYLNPLLLRNKFKDKYDIVLFIDYKPFQTTDAINRYVVRQIQENNGPSFLYLLGCDAKVREWNKINAFTICNSCLMYDQKSFTCNQERYADEQDSFLSGLTGIVAGAFEYHEAHKYDKKICSPVQMPMECEPFENNIPTSALKVLHGLNRYGFKGTQIVEHVFSLLDDGRYPGSSFKISDRQTLDNWLSLLKENHVIVDQLHNTSLGMNSLSILGSGRILVAGDVSRAATLFGTPKPPMIASEPSIEGLTRALTDMFESSESLKHYPEQGIQYIKDHHSVELVAQKFLKVFGV
jgi:hypothetical protein